MELDMMDDAPASNASPDDDDDARETRQPRHPAQGAEQGGHRIDIVANRHRVRVIHLGVTVADTQAALTLRR